MADIVSRDCTLEIYIGGEFLVYSGDDLTSEYVRRSYTFQSAGDADPGLYIIFYCTAGGGEFIIDNVSLVGRGKT